MTPDRYAEAKAEFRAVPASPDLGIGLDAPDFGTLAWLRRASGDARLCAWRLTPERLGAYLTSVRAVASLGPAVEAEDPGAVLDLERQPLLRPWEYPPGWPGPGDPDPARALAELIGGRAALAGALRPYVALDEFAAAHLRLVVCARALVLLSGDDATRVPERVRAWVHGQHPESGAQADFVASLVTAAEGYDAITSAFPG